MASRTLVVLKYSLVGEMLHVFRFKYKKPRTNNNSGNNSGNNSAIDYDIQLDINIKKHINQDNNRNNNQNTGTPQIEKDKTYTLKAVGNIIFYGRFGDDDWPLKFTIPSYADDCTLLTFTSDNYTITYRQAENKTTKLKRLKNQKNKKMFKLFSNMNPTSNVFKQATLLTLDKFKIGKKEYSYLPVPYVEQNYTNQDFKNDGLPIPEEVQNQIYNKTSKKPERIKLLPKKGGSNKKYIKLQSGGKRLIRHGTQGGKYYMKGRNKVYIK